jgi:hypothetical protein
MDTLALHTPPYILVYILSNQMVCASHFIILQKFVLTGFRPAVYVVRKIKLSINM